MKNLFYILIFLIVSACGGEAIHEKKEKNRYTILNDSTSKCSLYTAIELDYPHQKGKHRFVISYCGEVAAYKRADSAWVILDAVKALETVRLIQESNLARHEKEDSIFEQSNKRKPSNIHQTKFSL